MYGRIVSQNKRQAATTASRTCCKMILQKEQTNLFTALVYNASFLFAQSRYSFFSDHYLRRDLRLFYFTVTNIIAVIPVGQEPLKSIVFKVFQRP